MQTIEPPVLPIPEPPEAWPHPHDVHAWIRLQFGRHVAVFLRQHPKEAYDIAREYISKGSLGQELWPDHREWLTLIETKSVEEVARLLEEDSQNANRLRSSLPFKGPIFCSPEQVAAIKKKAFTVKKTLFPGLRR